MSTSYPPTRRGPDRDDYHGESVADPYRWLEATDDPETATWIDEQSALTESFLAAVPDRQAMRSRLRQLWDYPRQGVPYRRGGRWFQWRQPGLADQPRLYVCTRPHEEGSLLLDPNRLADDGTVAVTATAITDDGSLLAYATSEAGSDWMTWHVREVATGRDAADRVEWSKFCRGAWRGDGSGFYYSGVEAPAPGAALTAENHFLAVYFHRLGTAQSDDEAVFAPSDQPEWLPEAAVTDDGRFVVVTVVRGTFPENQLHVLDLAAGGGGWRTLVGDFSCQAHLAANQGDTFFLVTDAGAARRRLVAVDLARPGKEHWREVVGEGPGTLQAAYLCGGRLVCHHLVDAHSALSVHALDGSHLHDISVPGLASVADPLGGEGVEGRAADSLVHFGLTSFSETGSVWTHHLDTASTQLLMPSGGAVDPDLFLTEQVFAISPDGTRVPIFLTRRRDVLPTGEVPTLLYGYGGFNIPLTPGFSVTHAAWLERGGLLAVANLRGGGEYGRTWYDAGRLAGKQNVFDDFCACARWLAGSGWTRAEHTAISGGSNGGLLVGACLTQHPELFGAAVAEVGVFDMLRFHKFTIGWAWKSDFGDPDDPEQYPWPRSYSPLHHVVDGRCYPPTLLMTGDHDDRVVPGHSFKFAATLQAAQGCDHPILLRVDRSAGHGAGKPSSKQIDAAADALAFLAATVGWSVTEAG